MMENLTYENIVRNLDGTINSITAKMERIKATRLMSAISEYSMLQNQLQYYTMLRTACAKRIGVEPTITPVEEVTEVWANDEIVAKDVAIYEKVSCSGCNLPLLEAHHNCPMCGTHLNWEPVLFKDGLEVARVDNGFLKRIITRVYNNGVGQLSMFKEEK